jgi:hypothetical protein
MSSSVSTTPPPQPPWDFKLELLKAEYFFLETTIEDYNKQIWGIKALGLTGTGAVIVLMLQQKQPLIALIGCAIPILFWILESQWKHFQRGFYSRVAELESILTHQFDCLGPCIYGKWSTSFKRPTRPQHVNYWRDGLFNRSVYVTYILEIAFLLGLYLFRDHVKLL